MGQRKTGYAKQFLHMNAIFFQTLEMPKFLRMFDAQNSFNKKFLSAVTYVSKAMGSQTGKKTSRTTRKNPTMPLTWWLTTRKKPTRPLTW